MLETVEVAHGFMFEFSHSWKSLESEDGGRFDTQTTRPEESELREASWCMRQPGFFLFPVGDPPKKCLEDDPSSYYEG